MEPGSDDEGDTSPTTPPVEEADGETQPPPPVLCGNDPSAYTPYTTGTHPTGSVLAMPWQGSSTTYPASNEDFRGYGAAMPTMVECSNNKNTRSHLDVTAGCLNAITDTHGQIVSTDAGAFRALALGYTATDPTHPIRWTKQSIEYSFFYTGTSGPGVLPGFKAFARYNTEEDLYVASWRTDGVVQIQRKQCGVYTPLKILHAFGAPTTNTWHRIRFDTIGDTLELYLDGVKVISVTDSAFASGTMGLRTDAMTGALIDDWRVN
ncbi:MAG: hypothetical protein H0T65_03500 [Deltaproteobacteria bacterium]|nr:hypothetical protein [Deltaproteobacteria bacterium]